MKCDELKCVEEYGEDYTVKLYEREDCKHYAVVVYETDDDSKVVYTSKALNSMGQAKELAFKHAMEHEKEMKK